MIKNTLVLGLVLLLVGCSSDNDDNDITSLDPIIGTWYCEVIDVWASLGIPTECNIGELGTWENLSQEFESTSQNYLLILGGETERETINFNSSFTEFSVTEDGITVTFVKQ